MLELKNITKSFGDANVLNGKTTLLNIILGITDATSGQILYDGEDLTHVPMEKRGFNIVFQDYALFPNLTAYENITYGLRNNPGISSPDEFREMIALDGVIKESIKAKIKQIVDQYQLTTIMVTHDPEEACTMSDRVLILNQGRIAQYDTPENIIEHPASDFVRTFILHQLEVKRNNIYSLFNENTPNASAAGADKAA